MSKHTPGPWMCRAYPQVVDLPKASKMIVIESDDENSYHIGFACSWIDNPETAKEAMANASLIAAAPDLLEACVSALEELNKYVLTPHPEWSDGARAFCVKVMHIEAVIARAKGGE